MGRRTQALTVALAMVAGWLGGALGGRPVLSQQDAAGLGVFRYVTASQFNLIDADGDVRAQLCLPNGQPLLTFNSRQRHWVAGPGPDGRTGRWGHPIIAGIGVSDDHPYVSVGGEDDWKAGIYLMEDCAFFVVMDPEERIVWRSPLTP